MDLDAGMTRQARPAECPRQDQPAQHEASLPSITTAGTLRTPFTLLTYLIAITGVAKQLLWLKARLYIVPELDYTGFQRLKR